MIPPEVRAIIAATAIAHSSNRSVSSIYDYSGSGFLTMEVSVSNGRVTGYDYSTSAHFDGNIPNLYHYGHSGHVEFKHMGGSRYEGYFYGSSSHFEVTVSGRNAEFYDYGGSGFTSYSA